MITYFTKLLYSFKCAISGLAIFFITERNAKIHGLAALITIAFISIFTPQTGLPFYSLLQWS
jgi:diacylglycerol kinase